MTEGAPIAEEAVLREPWSNTFGRYAANVAIAYGFSAIIKVLAGDLLAHQAWDAPIGFSLVMGAFFASRADGTKSGFDLEMIARVRREVSVPLIASGGAGEVAHFPPAVTAGADAVLAASVFHFGQLSIGEVKAAMAAAGTVVRGRSATR